MSPATPAPESHDRTAQFVRLLRQSDRQLATFVHAIVPSWADAEDIIQETSVRLWEQFDKYEAGSDFGAWACSIARYLVMSHREKASRDRLQFSPEIVDRIAQEVDRLAPELELRQELLATCLRKLSEPNRRLLALCYDRSLKITEVAELVDRSANAVYLSLSRLRRKLHDCVERKRREMLPERT